MADFSKQGGVLTGREERYDGFAGEPRSVGGAMSSTSATDQYTSTTGSSTGLGSSGHHSGSAAATKDRMNPKTDSDRDGKAGIMD